ncbi:MAG: VCBS repeat-containing protein [Verrucomicrobiota bacterium]
MARNILELIHLSLYGGICTADFDNDGLTDFYVTSPVGGNRLYHNLGDFRFEDVTESAGLLDTNFWGTGATFVDINNDGRLDIYACGYRRPNRLFINQGPGSDGRVHFVEKAHEYGLDFNGASMTMAFGDFDRDGDLDAYLATTALPPPPGVKFGVRYEGSKPVVPKELQEYWELLYLPGNRPKPTEAGQFDHFYRNDGGRFTEITSQAGIDGPFMTLSALWWDFDCDGWPDLYVSNDYLGPDKLYRNNGNGTFTDVIRQTVPHTPWSSMGTDIGDLNNDGRIDLMTTDMLGSTHFRRNVMMGEATKQEWFLEFAEPRQYIRNAVFLNTGVGRMMEFAYQGGLAGTDWTWGGRIEDFDNDGREDIFVTDGMVRDVQNADVGIYADRTFGGGSAKWAEFWASQALLRETNKVFRNVGELRFERAEIPWGLARQGVSFGCATADFDNDGRLDLVVNNADAPVSIYRNQGATGHSIRIRLKGTQSNRFGVGATVRVEAGGAAQVRYLTLARGWLSATEPVLHFGLGNATRIASLTIDWPCSPRQSFTNLEADRFYTITEPTNSSRVLVSPLKPVLTRAPLFQATNLLDNISIVEPPFDDFAREPLLPWKLSQRSGCTAWGDVNGDGNPDLFIGGTPGQPGRLFIRNAAGRFEASAQTAIEADKDCEDAAAVFFDADHDGDLDLLVVGGGVREEAGSASYRHRLYLNNGNGLFSPAPTDALPWERWRELRYCGGL